MKRVELEELLEEVKTLLSINPKLPRSLLFGDWDSPFKGDGMEFEEIAEFREGDNPKRIHGPLSSRFGKPMVVRYLEPREVRMLVIMDASPSMMLREKMKTAFSAFAMLYTSTKEIHMPMALWVIGEDYEVHIDPPMNEQDVDTLIDVLCGDDADSSSITRRENSLDLSPWETYLLRDSIVFLISDFLDDEKTDFKIFLQDNLAEYLVIPAVVQDDLEYTFPDHSGLSVYTDLEDVETGSVKHAGFGSATSAETKTKHEYRFSALQNEFWENDLLYAHLPTPDMEDIDDTLQEALMESREMRR